MSHRRRVIVFVAAALAAGLIGWATDAIADEAGYRFPSIGASLLSIVWKVLMVGLLVAAFRATERTTPTLADLGWVGDDVDAPTSRARNGRAALALAGLLVLLSVVSSLIGDSPGDSGSYDGDHKAGMVVLAVELLVRYPLTVFAEESFFRGWLQPRLPYGILTSGLLFGVFHLQQASTIPSLIVIGLILGVLRWWRGNVRVSAAAHYFSNAAFLIANYA